MVAGRPSGNCRRALTRASVKPAGQKKRRPRVPACKSETGRIRGGRVEVGLRVNSLGKTGNHLNDSAEGGRERKRAVSSESGEEGWMGGTKDS